MLKNYKSDLFYYFITALVQVAIIYLFFSNGFVQEFMFNSDQLTIPSLSNDIILNKYFSILTWMIPRAPYIFPDLSIYMIFNLIVKDSYYCVILMSIFHILLLLTSSRIFLRFACEGKDNSRTAYIIFLIVCLGLTTAALFEGGVSVLVHPFIAIAHGTAAVSALLGYILYEKKKHTKSLVLHFLGFLLYALATFSDKLIIVFFSFPYAICLALTLDDSKSLKRLTYFVFETIAVVTIVSMGGLIFEQQPLDRLEFDILSRLSTIVSISFDYPLTYSLLFGGIVFAVLLLKAHLRFNRKIQVHHIIRIHRSRIFISLMSGFGLAIGVLLWRTPEPAYARYLVGMQIGTMLSAAIFLCNTKYFNSYRNLLILCCAFALSVASFASGNIKNVKQPFSDRAKDVLSLEKCRTDFGLTNGYAQYWIARKLSVETNWDFQVNQFEPAAPVPFFWGNNFLWYFYGVKSAEQLHSNFIIENGFKRQDIQKYYGAPSQEVTCGDFSVLIYGDAEKLRKNVNHLLVKNKSTDIFAHFPDKFNIEAEYLGRYDIKSMSSQTGALAFDSQLAKSPFDQPGFLLYGPYLTLPVGDYLVKMSFSCTGMETGNFFDVTAAGGTIRLVSDTLKSSDNRCDGKKHDVSLNFKLQTEAHDVEFRAFFGGNGIFKVWNVRLEKN